jgi:hypothetical protein
MSAAGVARDMTAIEVEAPSRRRIVTTLSDLSVTLNDCITPGEEDLITAAVVRLLHSGRVKILGRPLHYETSMLQKPQGSLLLV